MRRIAAVYISVMLFILPPLPCFAEEIKEYDMPDIINTDTYQKVGYGAGEEIRGVCGTILGGKNIVAIFGTDIYTLSQDGELKYDFVPSGIGFRVSKGDKIGTITLLDDFGNTKSADLYAAEDAATPKIMIGAAIVFFLLLSELLGRIIKRLLKHRKGPLI